jgi:hypothetical protein
MWRPAEPKTSPTKRIFTERVYIVEGPGICTDGAEKYSGEYEAVGVQGVVVF